MRALIAFDKFKGALSAGDACAIAADVLARVRPDWEIDLCPLSDGGEGFSEILSQSVNGALVSLTVGGPAGSPVAAKAGIVPVQQLRRLVHRHLQLPAKGTLAIAEMAAASGLSLLTQSERDPWCVGTRGTGELLARLAARRVSAILLGVGGSATNDLGTGALAALGVEFTTPAGAKVDPPLPNAWGRIAALRGAVPADFPPLYIACDVTNPLLGAHGATAVYGPQKGLAGADVPRFEGAATRMAGLLCAHFGRSPKIANQAGMGAAGGIAFGLAIACDATLVPGFELFSDWMDLRRRLRRADVVITGEGRFDDTSMSGKGAGALAIETESLGKEVHVFAGACTASDRSGLHSITPRGMELEHALKTTPQLLRRALERHFTPACAPWSRGARAKQSSL